MSARWRWRFRWGTADLKDDQFEYNRFGATQAEPRRLADWLGEQGVVSGNGGCSPGLG